MLGKLIKYDWKAFWKVPAFINLSLIIFTVVGAISLATPLWELDSDIISSLLFASASIYYISIVAGFIAVTAYIAVRYYKLVYSDEGYLTHTLPVKTWEIILSKLLVSFIWTLITGLVILFSIFLLLGTAVSLHTDYNVLKEVFIAFKEIAVALQSELGLNLSLLLTSLVLLLIVSNIFSILMIFSSIALGQLFPRHRVMGAAIWYIVEFLILQFGSMLFSTLPILTLDFSGLSDVEVDLAIGRYFNTLIYGFLIFLGVLSAAMFFISNLIMKKELNLE